jgi:hypothetical protein
MMSITEMRVVEIPRQESVNGYVYEYDESLASVKEIQRTHEQRINWWRENADAEPGAEAA